MRKNTEYLAVNKQLQSEIDYRVIGRHMQAIRQKCGMTQAVVAEKMKLGVKYYAALEAGTESISLSRLIQFICLMQSSSDTLLAGCHPDYNNLRSNLKKLRRRARVTSSLSSFNVEAVTFSINSLDKVLLDKCI